MIDRRLLIHFDWTLFGIILLLSFIGILNLYSVTSNGDVSGTSIYIKQSLWLLIGIGVMLGVAFIEYRYYMDFAYPIYTITLILLLMVLGYGIITSGAQRWFKVGSLSFQPSEFIKVSLIIALAKFFQRPPDKEGYSLKQLYFPFFLIILPVVLILKQPDLGTAIILFLVFFSILFFVKVRFSSLLSLVGIGGATLPIVWQFLKDYQRRRIITFLNPDMDPLGAGYHIIQSKIAVGSGGIFGKGFMQGTQCRLGFLPEPHTDFVFSAIGEEWGLAGCLFVLGLYFILILWGFRIAIQSKDRFGAIISFGVVAMLFWHIFINIGMVIGIMPVVGIPLPLMSYGGSFLFSTLIGIGLLLNVSMRRYLF